MRAALLLLTLLGLLLRGGARLRIAALRSPQAVMDFVSRYQPVLARKLFFVARLFGGMETRFERRPGAVPPGCLIVSNHQSLADIPAIAVTFSDRGLRYVAKKELGRGIPYVSPSLRLGRHALISRTRDYREGQESMRQLAALSRQGICPVVFPEGTRSRDGKVKSFYAGALRIMLERQPMRVLSVAVDGGFRVATVPRLLLHSRGVVYRVRPLTLYPAPHGKKEIMELIQRMEVEISAQVEAWREEERAAEKKKPATSRGTPRDGTGRIVASD